MRQWFGRTSSQTTASKKQKTVPDISEKYYISKVLCNFSRFADPTMFPPPQNNAVPRGRGFLSGLQDVQEERTSEMYFPESSMFAHLLSRFLRYFLVFERFREKLWPSRASPANLNARITNLYFEKNHGFHLGPKPLGRFFYSLPELSRPQIFDRSKIVGTYLG
jgi:hypothetical protein